MTTKTSPEEWARQIDLGNGTLCCDRAVGGICYTHEQIAGAIRAAWVVGMAASATKAVPPNAPRTRLFSQLEAWRARGHDPQLYGTPDGWVLVLDTTKRGMYDVGERTSKMLLRFNTATCESPEEAIEAALRVIQP